MTEERTTETFEGWIPGSRVRSGHSKTLFAILGKKKMIPLHSRGDEFFMLGHFPYRKLVNVFVDWVKKNPRAQPGRSEFLIWARAINDEKNNISPSITIAQTNDEISRRTYMALIGGANHEGFHRLYTFQDLVTYLDLDRVVSSEWKNGLPYEKAGDLLLETMNVFEDIRIERIGCAEFPGVYYKMADLADFILDQEAERREKELSDPNEVSPIRIALATLREVGLGYSTEKTRAALLHYRAVCPEAVESITYGPLGDILREIVPNVSSPEALSRAKAQYDLSARLAFRAVAEFLKNPLFQKEAKKPSPRRLKDYAVALQEVLLAREADLEEGEAPYNPYTTEHDRIEIVGGDLQESQLALQLIVQSTRRATSYLRSRLRNLFRALEVGDRLHGVKRGVTLSERFLVDTFASLRAREEPRHAFIEESVTIDTSIAAYILLDESRSMIESAGWVKKILFTLGESFYNINAKFAMVGFQGWYELHGSEGGESYHRSSNDEIVHHVYKGFDERWRNVAWRIANFYAYGGTPMADGIELGLRALSSRREGHRVLLVVTDGAPDKSHAPVVKNQIRRASEAGIHLLGVGLGKEARYVKTLFPEHVWAEEDFDEIPALLVEKITNLVREIGVSRRGRAVQD